MSEFKNSEEYEKWKAEKIKIARQRTTKKSTRLVISLF
jgi:hypothetical protein